MKGPVNIRFYTDYPVCNYKCPYCIAGHAPPEGRPPSDFNDERYLQIVDNICKLSFPVNIRIGVGGEFFVSKTLLDGAKRLGRADNVRIINLITNLSFHPKHYARILADIPSEKIALVASYHPTEVKDEERWITNALELSQTHDLAIISVAYPPALHNLPLLKERFNSLGLDFFVQPYIGEYDGRMYPAAYSEEDRTLLKSVIYSRHDYEFLLNLKKPGLCNAGFKFMYINPLGIVTPCGGANHGKILGDLSKSPDIVLTDGPRPCPALSCQCDTENINTTLFEEHYTFIDRNQHRFRYRFSEEAKEAPWMDEWNIPY